MTPREALYLLCMELGPVPTTKREDNITAKEARLRDAVTTLQALVEESESTPETQSDYAELREALNDIWRNQIAKQ